jgi:hypothetical protein
MPCQILSRASVRRSAASFKCRSLPSGTGSNETLPVSLFGNYMLLWIPSGLPTLGLEKRQYSNHRTTVRKRTHGLVKVSRVNSMLSIPIPRIVPSCRTVTPRTELLPFIDPGSLDRWPPRSEWPQKDRAKASAMPDRCLTRTVLTQHVHKRTCQNVIKK